MPRPNSLASSALSNRAKTGSSIQSSKKVASKTSNKATAPVKSPVAEASASKTGWKEIADSVQRDIEHGVVAVGDLLPSETELTKEWKVSRMTAHRAMQELQRSGLVTRHRGRGTVVADPGRPVTGKIALLFHGPLDRLELEYMRGINVELANRFQFLLCDSYGDVHQEAQSLQLMKKEAEGIICMPSGHPANSALLQRMVESGYPIVCIDRVPQNVGIDAVVSDNFDVSIQALQGLVARRHRRIAHFTQDQMQLSAVRERYDAFMQVMREVGESHPERLVHFLPTDVQQDFDFNVQITRDALFAWRHQSDPPTAIFCLNDYCLTLVLAALDQLELQVPGDIEIVTFHDALMLTPSVRARLIRIVQEARKMGQLAGRRLQERIDRAGAPHEVVRVAATIHPMKTARPDALSGESPKGAMDFVSTGNTI